MLRHRAPPAVAITCATFVAGVAAVAGLAPGARATQHTPPRTIDVSLQLSTFLPGGSYDRAADVATDRSGNAYLAIATQSRDYGQTLRLSPVEAWLPQTQAVVTRIAADGTTAHWPVGQATLSDVVVDDSGNVYVAGSSHTPPGAPGDVFVAKVNAAGAIDYTVTFGGSSDDYARKIAVDATGEVVVVGDTSSPDFPLRGAYRSCAGAAAAAGEVFIVKLDRRGALLHSTCFGGSGIDMASGVGVDQRGEIIVMGMTRSSDLPITPGALQRQFADTSCEPRIGCGDVFVARFTSDASRLIWATYLGGRRADVPEGFVVDAAGEIYISGWTTSSDFPVPNAFQRQCRTAYSARDCGDAFVVRLHASGSQLQFGTFLGGSSWETAAAIDVSADGMLYVAGSTSSGDLLGRESDSATPLRETDGFLAVLNGSGVPIALRLLKNDYDERVEGVAVAARGVVYVSGYRNLPTLPGSLGFGDTDAYVARLVERR